jgi:hypothetical protein
VKYVCSCTRYDLLITRLYGLPIVLGMRPQGAHVGAKADDIRPDRENRNTLRSRTSGPKEAPKSRWDWVPPTRPSSLNPGSWRLTESWGDFAESPLISSGSNHTPVLIIACQSVTESIAPTAYTPTNASAEDNFNNYDVAIYA